MKKDIKWLKNKLRETREKNDKGNNFEGAASMNLALRLIGQLDEPETLSQEWIDENKVARIDNLRKMTTSDVVTVEKLQNLLVQKQEEVDRAYKDGYEKGKEYTFYKGYLEGLADKSV